MKTPIGRGRRAGNPETRETIRQAARAHFLSAGYRDATLRSIAADAGVDVALVSYYFGSKRDLFTAAMALPVNPADTVAAMLEGDDATLAVRMLRGMLAVWDAPESGGPLVALAGTVLSDPGVRRLAAEAVAREIVAPLAERIGGPDAGTRAAAFGTQVSGVIFSRYLLRIEPIASMPAEEIVRALAPSLALTLAP